MRTQEGVWASRQKAGRRQVPLRTGFAPESSLTQEGQQQERFEVLKTAVPLFLLEEPESETQTWIGDL